jgi:hypothetical protein
MRDAPLHSYDGAVRVQRQVFIASHTACRCEYIPAQLVCTTIITKFIFNLVLVL